MKKYYVAKEVNGNGEHEVHDEFCFELPGIGRRLFLGEFPSCSDAVVAGRYHFGNVNGCIRCSPACHPLYFP